MTISTPTNGSGDDGSFGDHPAAGTQSGGWLATAISALAFTFSGFSFYESVLKQPDLEVFVPPVIHYARDDGGDIELFSIPITITNEGARTGTVLSMDLDVEAPGKAEAPNGRRYYSAYLGEHSSNADAVKPAFAPVSIPGKATFTGTVRFYPADNPLPHLVDDAGNFRFKLTLNMAAPSNPDWFDRLGRAVPQPLSFTMTLPWFSEQQLGLRRASIAMHAKDFRPTASAAPSPDR